MLMHYVFTRSIFSQLQFQARIRGRSQYHTVTYSENDNITDPVFALQTENAPSDLSAFVSFSPRFTYAASHFR